MTIAAAFLGSIMFGIIVDVPRRVLGATGIAGLMSWIIADTLLKQGLHSVVSYFLATLIAGSYAELMARYTRNPVSIFIIPGIVPLVPGAGAYYTVQYFVKNEFTQGLAKGMETLFIAGAIAFGLAIVSVLFRFARVGQKNDKKVKTE